MKVLAAMVLVMGFAGTAFSDECSQGIGQQGFQSGFQSQSAVLDILWNNYGDCFDHENFLEAVEVPFASESSSRFVRCRAVGMQAALHKKMGQISQECSWDAAREGQNTGLAVARQFCQSACWSGYRTVSQPIYPLIYKQACKASFTSYVSNHCPFKANSADFFSVRSRTCSL